MKEKTALELKVEASLAEWTLHQRIKERLNEYNFQQRIARSLDVIAAVDDDYVRNMSKVMFGEDIDLSDKQVADLKPVCVEVALEDLAKLFPIFD